jgi:Lrp/AsnC family leucine-responsive transcriptional regulator
MVSQTLSKLLDATNKRIVRELQQRARISISELGRKISLSAPATQERLRRLEEAGIIRSYRAEVDAAALGLPIFVFIRINTPTRAYPRFLKRIEQLPEIIECHHVAGVDSFILKARLASNAHLETLLRQLSAFGETTTSIVLSSPIAWRAVEPSSEHL